MKLYWVQVAPNPTKVRLYIAEKLAGGATLEVEGVVVKLAKGEHRLPEHRARNPFESLPVLELDDGSTIVESLAIIEYLEELHPAPPLWGEETRTRARAREVERIVDQRLLNPLATYVHATASPTGRPANVDVADRAAAEWPMALLYLDELLADERPFLLGEAPTVGDCTLAATLQFARFAKVDLLAGLPSLARWDAAYRARPIAQMVLTL
ncbi:MAG: glutathione S-transferase family protein [Gammaproteobacteria bacterium]